jgi:flagellar hook assembly protein FlgD
VNGPVRLRIYDALGREVALLAHPGKSVAFEMAWNGRDQDGQAVAAGAYFWQLEAPGARTQGKLIRTAP